MGLFSRKSPQPEDVGLPLPELEEPEPIADDEEPPGPPRVLKLDGDDDAGGDDVDLLALAGGDGGDDGPAAAPQAAPAAKDDLLNMFSDVDYVDPVVEHLLSRVRDVSAEDLLLEAREVRLQLKGALPADAAAG